MEAAGASFAGAMSTTLLVGAAVAMMGAVLAFVFVPGRRAADAADPGQPADMAGAERSAAARSAADPAFAEHRQGLEGSQ